MLIPQFHSQLFSPWNGFYMEGVEFFKPIKNLQLNLKHKEGFHMTTAKCKRALKLNSGELIVLKMCVYGFFLRNAI